MARSHVFLRVTPYSTLNLLSLNLFATIPVVSWAGAGPDMTLNQSHYACTVEAGYDTIRGLGFDMGLGRTTLFSARIVESGDP